MSKNSRGYERRGSWWSMTLAFPPGPNVAEGVRTALPGIESVDWYWTTLPDGRLLLCFRDETDARTFVEDGGFFRVI